MAQADEALAASIGVHAAPATLRVFALLTHLGDPAWLTLLGAGVALWLWARRKRALALGWALALGGNALLNPALKRIFERIRPVHEHGLFSEIGFSFPSGHTSELLRLLPAGAVAGRGLHPLESAAFARRTPTA